MSNEVYFNEPGYEREIGTVIGEQKNTGYCNIIRYATVKYAILENLKHPPKGFESVIRRSYYIKKKEICAEIEEWISKAQTEQAIYQELTMTHNE